MGQEKDTEKIQDEADAGSWFQTLFSCRWSALEQNFALLVIIIVLINLNILNLFYKGQGPRVGYSASARSGLSVALRVFASSLILLHDMPFLL